MGLTLKKATKKAEAGSISKEAFAPNGIRCPACQTRGSLFCMVIITKKYPLVKGGGLKLAGRRLTNADAKEAWDADTDKHITCLKCGEKYEYKDKLARVS